MKRVLICGGVSFSDEELFNKTLDEMIDKENTVLVSGHAKGADTLAEKYAEKHGIEIKVFPPEWSKYQKAAGPIRNRQMLGYISEADEKLVIAFWNGQSRGTKHTVETAEKMGIETQIIYY
jgi:hypothetical protein